MAMAQHDFSGSQKCPAAKPQHNMPTPTRPQHVLSLLQGKCTWTKGEIGGVKAIDEEDVIAFDVGGGKGHEKGYGASRLADGDTAFVQFEGATAFKDTIPLSDHGTWKFTGGTGKLKKLSGGGSYTGQFNADGTSIYDIKGTYQLGSK
jgi:hypothetical protein